MDKSQPFDPLGIAGAYHSQIGQSSIPLDVYRKGKRV
jgi:hypothetical protein